jgi:type I restriction enzyme S subunit
VVTKGMRKIKLKEVCDRITVGHVGPMADKYTAEGVPFLRSQNITAFRLNLDDIKYIPPDFHEKLRKSALQAGDVAVVRTGYPGTACVIPNTFTELNCADLVVITPSRELNPYYLAAIFNSAWGVASVAGNLVGVAQQHFNIGAAREMEVSLPPRPTQDRIAGILSPYDELIENSQRRIPILESMARALYREWFVHFRFPGHEKLPRVASPLGEIPQGWEVKTVEEIVKRIPVGRKYDQKTVNPTGAVPVFDQGKSGIIGYHDDEPSVVASETAPVIVFANHTCYQRLIHFPFSAIQNVLPFVPSPSLPRNIYWLHWATNGLVVFNDYKGHWPEFAAKTLVVPQEDLCQRFGDFAAPLSRQILKLEHQIQNLRRTRDLLLPRLLSGQIDAEAA